MANKCVPTSIAGVELHEDARKRTHALLQTLEDSGAAGVSTPSLSMIDRFRLLASAFFTLLNGEKTHVIRDEGQEREFKPGDE